MTAASFLRSGCLTVFTLIQNNKLIVCEALFSVFCFLTVREAMSPVHLSPVTLNHGTYTASGVYSLLYAAAISLPK